MKSDLALIRDDIVVIGDDLVARGLVLATKDELTPDEDCELSYYSGGISALTRVLERIDSLVMLNKFFAEATAVD